MRINVSIPLKLTRVSLYIIILNISIILILIPISIISILKFYHDLLPISEIRLPINFNYEFKKKGPFAILNANEVLTNMLYNLGVVSTNNQDNITSNTNTNYDTSSYIDDINRGDDRLSAGNTKNQILNNNKFDLNTGLKLSNIDYKISILFTSYCKNSQYGKDKIGLRFSILDDNLLNKELRPFQIDFREEEYKDNIDIHHDHFISGSNSDSSDSSFKSSFIKYHDLQEFKNSHIDPWPISDRLKRSEKFSKTSNYNNDFRNNWNWPIERNIKYPGFDNTNTKESEQKSKHKSFFWPFASNKDISDYSNDTDNGENIDEYKGSGGQIIDGNGVYFAKTNWLTLNCYDQYINENRLNNMITTMALDGGRSKYYTSNDKNDHNQFLLIPPIFRVFLPPIIYENFKIPDFLINYFKNEKIELFSSTLSDTENNYKILLLPNLRLPNMIDNSIIDKKKLNSLVNNSKSMKFIIEFNSNKILFKEKYYHFNSYNQLEYTKDENLKTKNYMGNTKNNIDDNSNEFKNDAVLLIEIKWKGFRYFLATYKKTSMFLGFLIFWSLSSFSCIISSIITCYLLSSIFMSRTDETNKPDETKIINEDFNAIYQTGKITKPGDTSDSEHAHGYNFIGNKSFRGKRLQSPKARKPRSPSVFERIDSESHLRATGFDESSSRSRQRPTKSK
ncbi:hypothetical protein B5S31_g5269 [[Candida] boidinii]|nr:hypothetical protein B5S29_g4878 [[Candida] boidinii]OWB75380.1 hypothetical protein B5S31_g5269 [[Candida] boidinii]